MNAVLEFLAAAAVGFVLAVAFIALVTWPRRTPAERQAAARRAAAALDSAHHQRRMNRLLADLHPKEDQT